LANDHWKRLLAERLWRAMIDTIDGAGRIAYPREASEAPPPATSSLRSSSICCSKSSAAIIPKSRRFWPRGGHRQKRPAGVSGARFSGAWNLVPVALHRRGGRRDGERRRIEKELGDQAVQAPSPM